MSDAVYITIAQKMDEFFSTAPKAADGIYQVSQAGLFTP